MAEKTKKPSFGGRIKKFFKDYKSEFKKVTWYSREQTFKSSLIVIVVVVALALVIGALDYLFYSGINLLGGIFA